jgi:hypothetical protein
LEGQPLKQLSEPTAVTRFLVRLPGPGFWSSEAFGVGFTFALALALAFTFGADFADALAFAFTFGPLAFAFVLGADFSFSRVSFFKPGSSTGSAVVSGVSSVAAGRFMPLLFGFGFPFDFTFAFGIDVAEVK